MTVNGRTTWTYVDDMIGRDTRSNDPCSRRPGAHRLNVAIRLGTVAVVVHRRPVVPVLSGLRRALAATIMVHLAVRPAVLRLLFPLVHVVRILRATAGLLLLHFSLLFLLHALVFGAPVLEPDFDLRTDNGV